MDNKEKNTPRNNGKAGNTRGEGRTQRPQAAGGKRRSYGKDDGEGNQQRSYQSRKSNNASKLGGGYRRRNKSNKYGDNDYMLDDQEERKPFKSYPKQQSKGRGASRSQSGRSEGAAPRRPMRQSDDNLVRLNKYIANAGICSRRDADKLIEAGAVSVNGEVVTTMGYKVKPGDVVSYGGEVLRSETKRYFLLNKPKGFITTVDDPHERHTVMMLVENCCKERIYPVGRLDRNTTGLLLFTNDGELAKKLTHPSSRVYKIYQVELDKPVVHSDMRQMLEGVELEDGRIAVDDVQYQGDDRRVVGVALHSGKNRIVRRIFESLGYEVLKLDRTVFAGLTKKDLPRGHVRELTSQEVGYLKMI